MAKSRKRKKKGIATTKNTFKQNKFPVHFIYERKCIALKPIDIGKYIALSPIDIGTDIIKQGEVFYLKDAFVDTENGQTGIFLGIKLPSGRIFEAGFLHPNAKKIRNKKDMDEAIFLTLVAPYVEGVTQHILFN